MAPRQKSSYPAHAGYPVCRGLSIPSSASLEYWIARWSLSSGGARRRPGGGRRRVGNSFAFPRRDAPELCRNRSPRKTEGVGNAECPLHPQPRVQSVESTRVSHHRFAGTPGIPARNGFNGFLRALPGDRACLSPSSALLLADLTPASRRQDHTTWPSASAPLVRKRHPRPPHPAPRP